MCQSSNWHTKRAQHLKCGILEEWGQFFILFIMEFFKSTATAQSYYWKGFGIAVKSWGFRMTTLTNEDLQNGAYCDKYQWRRGSDGVQNFWVAINEGHFDMTYEFFVDTF